MEAISRLHLTSPVPAIVLAIFISHTLALGVTERIAQQSLPADLSFAWTGQAFQEKETGSATGRVFGAAIVMVFLV